MRARNLKPSFFTNEELASVEPLARILFEGLWCMADRRGRLEDRPLRIKVAVLPYDHCEIDELLQSLVKAGVIVRYIGNGNRYIQIINFEKHQFPHPREKESTIPALGQPGTSNVQAHLNPLSPILNPDPPEPGTEPAPAAGAPPPLVGRSSETHPAKLPPFPRRFERPTPAAVTAYAREIGFDLDGQQFCDSYDAKGWKIGSTPMKDWRAAVRTWKGRQLHESTKGSGKGWMDD